MSARQCVCVQASPFRVRIDGGVVDALRLPEQDWTVGDVGRAFFDPPAIPLCFKTTR